VSGASELRCERRSSARTGSVEDTSSRAVPWGTRAQPLALDPFSCADLFLWTTAAMHSHARHAQLTPRSEAAGRIPPARRRSGAGAARAHPTHAPASGAPARGARRAASAGREPSRARPPPARAGAPARTGLSRQRICVRRSEILHDARSGTKPERRTLLFMRSSSVGYSSASLRGRGTARQRSECACWVPGHCH